MIEKKYKDQNRCMIVNEELGKLGQYIIYFFNKLPIRTKVIRNAIYQYKKDDKFCYFGTWYVEGPKFKLKFTDPYDEELKKDLEKNTFVHDFMKKNKHSFELKRKILFTVCYCYKINSVHFISFIYDSKKRKLICFDPGVHCYPEGQKILVPSIVKIFKQLKLIENNEYGKAYNELGDDCPQYQYILRQEPIGIQYNGKSKDAFCQSWSLFFLVDQIKQYDENIEDLCRIVPENRELHLYKHFIIPFLEKNPNYLKEIIEDLKEEYDYSKKPKTYLKLLKEYIDVCKVKPNVKPKKKQTVQKKKSSTEEKLKKRKKKDVTEKTDKKYSDLKKKNFKKK